ncbi:hypothetical protein [Sorangium sp. So ce426]|uniref:hypothetical protein n=1 Tax=unclassified Sorangium TaxID=2621164 RepID=UPI003F5C33F6
MIDDERYRWLVTEPERWIENASAWDDVLRARRLTLVVQHEGGRGQKLLAWVPVYRTPIHHAEVTVPCGNGVVSLLTPHQEAVVSSALVRRVIEYTLQRGWKPSESGSDFIVPEDALGTLLHESQPGLK